MTLKEAVLKSLEDINGLTNYLEVCNHIMDKKYYDFGTAKTPASTVSALPGATSKTLQPQENLGFDVEI